jgi:F-type H+-transporting ATPase subunit a
MNGNPFIHEVMFHLGPIPVTRPVITTWGVMLVLTVVAASIRRGIRLDNPGRLQSGAELLLSLLNDEMRSAMRLDPSPFLPLIGTIFLFILSANLSGLLPGVEPPTGALETDLVLALLVFVSTIAFGISRRGLWGYARSYGQPNILVLPLNLIEALTRVVSMTVRLFGNIMSGMFISAVVLALAGLLVPIPFMALELLTGLIQAYIFTVLSMVFIAAAANEADA